MGRLAQLRRRRPADPPLPDDAPATPGGEQPTAVAAPAAPGTTSTPGGPVAPAAGPHAAAEIGDGQPQAATPGTAEHSQSATPGTAADPQAPLGSPGTPTATPAAAAPLAADPATIPAPPGEPGFRHRGRLRRRLAHLRRVRELAYRDLGGFVFDAQRFGQPRPDLVAGKLTTLATIDGELRALERLLDDRRAVIELHEPGIAACPRCAELHASDARFCSACGLGLTGAIAVAGQDVAATPATAPATAGAPPVPAPAAAPGAVAPDPASQLWFSGGVAASPAPDAVPPAGTEPGPSR